MRETRDRTGGSARLCAVAVVALAFLVAGCGGPENSLHAHSHQERSISQLWWWMMTAAWIGFGLIVFLLALGWVRRRSEGLPFRGGDRAANILIVTLGIAVPMVLLSGLFVWSDIFVLKTVAAPNPRSTRMSVHVVGRQWFWDVRYPGTSALTANEIHIPVRTRVDLIATTGDVAHSFWVPALNRKIDMYPGRVNRILLYADRVGTYRGSCSEFCGLQHAHMGMLVIAQTPGAFRAWLARQERPAAASSGDGERIFQRDCSNCHQIRGTAADARVGPDLTHVASRRTLAALAIDNTRADLARWIRDPQGVKPGNLMPATRLSNAQLNALVSYLETLK